MSGQTADLGALLGDLHSPPLTQVGALELDAFLPRSERRALAAALNTLLASPTFASWRQGTTLEVRVPNGKDARYILEVAVDAKQQVRHLAPLTQTLERVFMKTLEDAGQAAPEG